MKATDNGITGGSNGSLGEATTSDLKKGFISQSCDDYSENELMEHSIEEMKEPRGFAGRPNGYER